MVDGRASLKHTVRRKRIPLEREENLLSWREFLSLNFKHYPTPYSFLLLCIYMPLILPSSWTAQRNKDGWEHVYHPLSQARWQGPLMLCTCYLKESIQWLECSYKVCATCAAWNSEVINQKFKRAFILFLHFFSFSPIFSVKASKPWDAYDAVPDAQSNITRHLMPNSTILKEHPLLWNVSQPFKEGFLQLGVISQTIRGVDLCVVLRVPWFHMLATLILESKHL